MALITFKKQYEPETLYDFLCEDDDGMVTDTTTIETGEKLCEGDISDVYLCDYNGISAVVKVPRNKADNDFLQNEAHILNEMCPDGNWGEKFNRFLPQVLYSNSSEGQGVANIFPYYKDWVSLADVNRVYFGLDFRDAVWMYKRTLIAIGYAHERGFVHGAVTPDHILIHPENHGGKLIDWSYASKTGEGRVLAISTPSRLYYPPEVFNRQPVTEALDIYMAAKVMIGLVGGDLENNEMPDDVPGPLQNALKRCVRSDPRMRPQNAWDFHKELDDILRRVVGPREFRPFSMPRPADK